MNDGARVTLTLSCIDQVGIVATVASYIASHQGWIVESANHSEPASGRFFMREVVVVPGDLGEFVDGFEAVASRFDMTWNIDTGDRKRVAILVSQEEHCLYDLLGRHSAGEFDAEIVCVVGNHPTLEGITRWHGIDFELVADKDFAAIETILDERRVDLVVLARYMQILPDSICEKYAGRIINIHHSFLPSFKGARPYHQAYESGVKLVGATCHYVTAVLDEGPIIEQDVIRIDHADSIEQIRRSGKDIEKAVLARGVRWHLENRILIDGKRSIVFR